MFLREEHCDGEGPRETRHFLPREGHIGAVEEPLGQHRGLVLAEVELATENAAFSLPERRGKDASGTSEERQSTRFKKGCQGIR